MDVKSVLSGAVGADALEVPFGGHLLLERPLLNKGTAFTRQERRMFGLLGLLPPTEETLDEQAARAYEAYQDKPTDLERHIYLRQLQDSNETLFYRLLLDHLAEMMPIVYTPTVGLACEQFSHIFRRPRGLFIAYPERDEIDEILENAASPQVEVIVVTDGERILGLGDQGAGGMGIPIGKLSLYTACGGIHPATTLPILLDVGTNNRERLDDPLYIGWRHERIAGDDYDAFIDAFVAAVMRKFPDVLLQWEDFAQPNAGPVLDRYRDRLCTFNDDIQGTAAVTTGTLLAAVAVAGRAAPRPEGRHPRRGSAGCGIAEQLVAAMVEEGLPEHEARSRFFLIDRPGLLHDGLGGLSPFQQKLVQPKDRVAGWRTGTGEAIGLLDVVRNARPTILIGISGQPGTFTEAIVRAMAQHVERPIIFPLSNPTSRAEATPADLIAWTDGRALIATGSPFDDVAYGGRRTRSPSATTAMSSRDWAWASSRSGAQRVSDAMFMAAARALADCSPARSDPAGALLPPLAESRRVSRTIALAVAAAAQREGLAVSCTAEDLERSSMRRCGSLAIYRWDEAGLIRIVPRQMPQIASRSCHDGRPIDTRENPRCPGSPEPSNIAGPLRIDRCPSAGCGENMRWKRSRPGVADRAVGVAIGRQGSAQNLAAARRWTIDEQPAVSAASSLRRRRRFRMPAQPTAPGSTADPRPGGVGLPVGGMDALVAAGLADQPRDRDATGRGPAAGHRRGDGAGRAGACPAAPGQGPLDPEPQRRRRLLPARRRPAEPLHGPELPEGPAELLRRAAARACSVGLTDAIFAPLAARRVVASRRADLQAARNDVLLRCPRPSSTSRPRGGGCSASARRSRGPSCS